MQAGTRSLSAPITNHETDPRELTRLVKAAARAEGFEKVGIAPAHVLSESRRQLEAWIQRGYHGSMAWMSRDPEMRTDPRKLFPEALSVLVVTKNYYTAEEHTEDERLERFRLCGGREFHETSIPNSAC